MPPPSEADAIKILFGIKDRYEKFHAVAYTDEAIETAVYTSSRYIPDRFLPDKAIDLIDEAGARVKLRQTTLPADLADIQKRIKFIVHRMENAIANHEFEKARFYSDEERKERENMRQLREKYNLDDSSTGVRHQGRYRRRGGALDRRAHDLHQGGRDHQAAAHRGRAAQARHQPGEGHLRAGARHPPLARRAEVAATARPARSCSWAPPASARPKWRARWPRSCSAARRAWSASTCPSTWRSTRSPS